MNNLWRVRVVDMPTSITQNSQTQNSQVPNSQTSWFNQPQFSFFMDLDPVSSPLCCSLLVLSVLIDYLFSLMFVSSCFLGYDYV